MIKKTISIFLTLNILVVALNAQGSKANPSVALTENKKMPLAYRKEILIALSHFPELKRTPIKFKIKKSKATLKTSPEILCMFLPKKSRKYVIVISNKSSKKANPLLLENLPFNARVGVLSHELSHVADFQSTSMLGNIRKAIGHLSGHYLDKMEYNTDLICIQHGMGTYLEAWSSYIRDTMHVQYWRGVAYADKSQLKYERYMNPQTIEKYISAMKDSSAIKAHSPIETPR